MYQCFKQEKKTATLKDSSDELRVIDDNSVGVSSDDVFSIEYEPESDHTEKLSHSDSSSVISGKVYQIFQFFVMYMLNIIQWIPVNLITILQEKIISITGISD